MQAGARQTLAQGLSTRDGGRQSHLRVHQIPQGGRQSEVPHWILSDARQSSQHVRQDVTQHVTLRVTLRASLRVSLHMTLCVPLRVTVPANLPVSRCGSRGQYQAVTTDWSPEGSLAGIFGILSAADQPRHRRSCIPETTTSNQPCPLRGRFRPSRRRVGHQAAATHLRRR